MGSSSSIDNTSVDIESLNGIITGYSSNSNSAANSVDETSIYSNDESFALESLAAVGFI